MSETPQAIAAPGISQDVAVAAIHDMAKRRGLHASLREAEQAWQDVTADNPQRRLAAAWRWLFAGHSIERVPVEFANKGQLPAWVVLSDGVGIITKLEDQDGAAKITWMGAPRDEAPAFSEIWVPVTPTAINDGELGEALEKERRGPATEAILTAIRAHLPIYLRVGLVTVFINSIAVLSSLFAMQVYDRVVPNLAYATLWVLASGVFVAYIFDLLLKVVRLKMLEKTARRIDEALSIHFFDKVIALKVDRRPPRVGSLVAQVRDYESIKAFFTSSTLFALADLPFILLFVVIIALIGGPVALVLVVFIPICILIGVIAYRPMIRALRQQKDEVVRRQGLLYEAISGAEIIKTQGGESNFSNQWLRSTREANKYGENLNYKNSYSQFATQYFQQVAYVALVIVGVYQMAGGGLTMGGLIACSMLAGRALQTTSGITNLLVQWTNAKYALDILNQLLKMPSDDDDSRQASTQQERLDLSVQAVQYAYAGAHAPQLLVPNLAIASGERIAVLGANGSGKSTLIKLLAGLATPNEGEVRVGGLDMQYCRPSWLRDTIGYLPQEVRLFSGTIADNISIGLARPSEQAMRDALEAVGLLAAVQRHPLGLQLPIKEGGFGLSGGQRQLVGLARLLLQSPRIWLLDEPSASLDNDAEERVIKLLKALPADRTLIFTTHRPAWLALCSRVIILQDGLIKADRPVGDLQQQLTPTRVAQQAKPSAQTPSMVVKL